MQWDPASQSNRYTGDELEQLRLAQDLQTQQNRTNLDRLPPTSYRFQTIVFSIPWTLALIFIIAHGFQQHQLPALPFGIPLLIGILVTCIWVLIVTRFKFSWMLLSIATATYAVFNL
jgi:hypothetical protein